MVGSVCLTLLCSAPAGHLIAEEPLGANVRGAFAQHCVRCHGQDGEVNGDVNLLAFKAADQLTEHPELLGKLIKVVEVREMPPEDEPQPEATERSELISALDQLMRQSVSQRRQLSHAPMRRMNRFQYNNAVTDLFELNCIVFTLPERMLREHKNYFRPETGAMADTVTVGSRPLGKSQLIEPRLAGVAPFPQDLRAEHGFDNRGDHLSLSPLLMESFLTLGQSITDSPDFTPQTVGVWKELFAEPDLKSDTAPAVRERLQSFLSRAFRKPVDDETLNRYTSFAASRIEQGLGFTDAIKEATAAAIASPRFLYIYDRASDGASVEPLTDLELASRLSFLLWGSIPDSELLELAAEGKLGDADALATQVDRMLQDQKVKRFCDSFPSQWLQLERIISSVPDPQRYPEFYFAKYRDSMHMMVEPLLLFETVLIENQPITQFIDSDFTYRSTLLREAYGEELPPNAPKRGNAVTVLSFVRLPVTDRRHGGMITNAAVMTMTSGSERTKPITRGAWLATVIFNDPPPAPPADVPPLAEKPGPDEQRLTLRERLTAHRQRADCRGCHEQIDPLGFALENYNAIGVWRDQYENGRDIDPAGTLFHKHRFETVVEFKDAILAEKDRFAEAFAGHLLSFALARPLDASDSLALEQIAHATAADDYRIQTMIKQIVLSEPFRHKRNPKQPTDAEN